MKIFIILVLPIFIDVLLIEVIGSRRNERSLDLLLPKIVPRKILEPRVSLDLGRPVLAKSVHRLSLNHFIDEVRGLQRPPLRYLVPLDLNLLREDVISYLLARLAHIGTLKG